MTRKLLFLLALLPNLLLAQHTIKGTFSPAEDYKFAILYKVTPTTSIYVNNAEIDSIGNFEFKLDTTVNKGMYRIVYALPQDEYNFDFIYNAKEDIALTFNVNEGAKYTKSQENKMLNAYTKSLQEASKSINAYYASNNQNSTEFNKVFNVLAQTQNEFEKASEGMIASHFIKASRPYIPTKMEDAKTFSENIKSNYFSNIDFSDTILQSSSFLIETVLNYVFNFSNPTDKNQGYKDRIDITNFVIGKNPEVKETIIEVLFNQFAETNNEEVANYISDKYLLPIAKAKKDNDLIEKLTVYKNTSIAALAPDFNFEVSNNKKTEQINLHDFNEAAQYVVVFWSSTCSHCLAELPKFHKYVQSLEAGKLKVIAIALEDDFYRWKEKTYDFPEFIHVYGEGKWQNPIGDAYGVTATPTYFILDTNKKILAKPYDFPALENYYKEHPIVVKKEHVQLDD
ncbi:TlpA family protein disulfide reductase [Lacinutrix sp. C3R15]|uniref:TlpA family protein disulfide reductase n=1 Tax=Flavobacteriaceae TaxID=49546 RepID=UPI001C08E57E|nr:MULTISPECIES: TlpA disulfide reductase family protein [Flavobacteriaceae]MBU2938268.1 TlpA family protein disulfide reductase [Lacinutrix sp. C3R15]MDO6621582.1 TlpA disulfide reductase family protein [Oceanihabitans sp. 1_MG-2023]